MRQRKIPMPDSSRRPILLWLTAVAMLTACDPATAPNDTIMLVRLDVGVQTVLIDRDGGPRSAATIPATGTVQARTMLIVATFHRGNGTPIGLDPELYEIVLTPTDPERLTFTRTEAFRGNLFRISAGDTQVLVTAVHVASGSVVFGPHNLTIN